MSMLAALGQVAHFAVGLGGNPLTIIGLVPIFAAGLAFMRYLSADPEEHPINVRYVSKCIACLGKRKLLIGYNFPIIIMLTKLQMHSYEIPNNCKPDNWKSINRVA